MSSSSVNAVTRWTARIVPLILLALAAIGVYIITGRICVDILIPNQQQGAAIAILILLYFFVPLGLLCYLRTSITIARDPGAVPLPPKSRPSSPAEARTNAANRMEQFWTKDVFECNDQGEPRWCAKCSNWKPDRSHHSKELGRCIRKMDHFCPWMGGMVSETSFKYFIQFNIYGTFFSFLCMSVGAYILSRDVKSGALLDPWIVLVVVLGGFFGVFCCALAGNGMNLTCQNLTTIDSIDHTVNTYFIAIRVPRSTPPSSQYRLLSLPLPEATVRDVGVNTFAVVETNPGENPWNLGPYNNWKSIMGDNLIDWLLPLRPSPESSYKSHISKYPVGPLIETLRARFNLGTIDDDTEK